MPPDERRLQELQGRLAKAIPAKAPAAKASSDSAVSPAAAQRIAEVTESAKTLVRDPSTSLPVAARAQRLVWESVARSRGFAAAAPEYREYLSLLVREHDADYAALAGMRQAEIALDGRRAAEAAAIASASMEVFQGNDEKAPSFLLLLAKSARTLNRHAQAADSARTLLRAYPNSAEAAEAMEILARSQLELRDFAAARETGLALARSHPESRPGAQGMLLAGAAHEREGRPDDARSVYRDGLKQYAGTGFEGDFHDALAALDKPAAESERRAPDADAKPKARPVAPAPSNRPVSLPVKKAATGAAP